MDQTDRTTLPAESSIALNETECLTTSDTTPLLSPEEYLRWYENNPDTTNTELYDKLDLSYIYALFSYILIYLILHSYILYAHRFSSTDIHVLKFTNANASVIYAVQIVGEVLKDDSNTESEPEVPLFTTAGLFLSHVLILRPFEYGFTDLYAVPVSLALVSICYVVFNLAYYLIYAFGTFISSLFSSSISLSTINIYRGDVTEIMKDSNELLILIHLFILMIGALIILNSLLTMNWMELRFPWIISVNAFAISTSVLLREKAPERLDPDGYIEKTKSFVSPYFAYYSLSLIWTTLTF